MKFSLLWTYLIIIKVGDHNKQLTGHAFWSALWNEHVLWPTTPTEVELFQFRTSSRPVGLQFTECPLKWYCQRRLGGLPLNGVCFWLH